MAQEKEEGQVKDVYETVTASLTESGFVNGLECRTRKEVLKVLIGEQSGAKTDEKKPDSNFVINELIREYLEWNGLAETSQVLTLESGQPKTPVSRSDLEKSLGVETGPNARQIPLIYTIVSSLKNNSNQ